MERRGLLLRAFLLSLYKIGGAGALSMAAAAASSWSETLNESKAMILGASGRALTPDEVAFYRDERPWGFILFARNVGEAAQVQDLVAAMRDSVGRPNAPVFVDQEGGRVQRLRPPLAPNYPPASALGAIYRDDPQAGLRAAWLLARLHAFDLGKLGITADCLPVLDVPIEGAHDVIGTRAYAKSPDAVAALGRATAEGLMSGGLLPVIKHMPGHGRAFADTHLALPTVAASREELAAHDWPPFRALRDLPMGMTAHVVFSAIDPRRPATTSPIVVEEVIRGAIGFDGLLMSDDTSMKALSGSFHDRAAAILDAGVDVVLHCNGDMGEMRGIAEGTRPLSEAAKARAERALAAAWPSDGLAEADARDEFARHFEAVA
jgi:beta-N-acetylhexosaminidase